MTLVLNEIHLVEGLRKTVLIAAADRRITKGNGDYHRTAPKLFEIPYLNGAVAYFGLAEFRVGTRTRGLWDLIPDFIRKNTDAANLEMFSLRLRSWLHSVIPASVLASTASGFHICGYGHTALPDHFFLPNFRAMNGFVPAQIAPTYKTPGSHFLGRDARRLGWDGSDPLSIKGPGVSYRNGDFRVHALTADLIDRMFLALRALPDFKAPQTPKDYKTYIRFKFRLISALHKQWIHKHRVGDDVDVLAWYSSNGQVNKV